MMLLNDRCLNILLLGTWLVLRCRQFRRKRKLISRDRLLLDLEEDRKSLKMMEMGGVSLDKYI